MTTSPVEDWASDFDVLDPGYVSDPFGIWADLRVRCPIAHTDRRAPTWMPTRYADVTAIAHDIEHFSSQRVAVIPLQVNEGSESGQVGDDGPSLEYGLPPISADPPLHTWTRRLILPWFSHRRVADEYTPFTREICQRLLDAMTGAEVVDAAVDYAQQIPVRVIAHILGVPLQMSDTFTDWVREVLELADDEERRRHGVLSIVEYLTTQLKDRRDHPGDDLLSELLHTEVDGAALDEGVVLGMAVLLLIAGVDTTWSAIGSSIWHLATHPEDRARLVRQPELMSVAVEELLRAYSPVTMARMVTEDFEYGGCPMRAEDKVLMNFPAANRDPEVFDDPDTVHLDREHNRHIAFGSGIHRCAGSNLARMELQVALEEFLARNPKFTLVDNATVAWAGGQVRGPRVLPLRLG
jgi:cytochrome P450